MVRTEFASSIKNATEPGLYDEVCLTRPVGGAVEAFVRYAGAEEWYRVAGAPVRARGPDPDRGEHERAHEAILARLTELKGPLAGGNEMPVDLLDG